MTFDRELTGGETRVTDLFLELLDDEHPKEEAGRLALSTLPQTWLTEDFALWLTEGLLTVVDGRVLAVRHLDENTHPLTKEVSE